MVQITNGQMTLKVPRSAFEMIYKASGFHIIKDERRVFTPGNNLHTPGYKTTEEEISDEETEDSDESKEEMSDLSEIPLSEMDFYQLCDYADQLGLDHRGIRSKKELRALIKNVI